MILFELQYADRFHFITKRRGGPFTVPQQFQIKTPKQKIIWHVHCVTVPIRKSHRYSATRNGRSESTVTFYVWWSVFTALRPWVPGTWISLHFANFYPFIPCSRWRASFPRIAKCLELFPKRGTKLENRFFQNTLSF